MARPVLLHHPASLGHDTGAHPERAERMVAVERALEARGWLGADVRARAGGDVGAARGRPPAAYLGRLEAFCARGGGMLDADTVASRGLLGGGAARRGRAAALVDALLGGEAESARRCTARPATTRRAARAMGFCLFNNVAVAARHALDAHGLERVLVVDWDVHHGNGTNDVFHARPRVLFASIHESPLYPGTGPAADVGSGPGEGFTVNLPVPGGSGDATWCSLVEHASSRWRLAYEPELVLVSAGFDAHEDDPLAGCAVTDAGFAAMAGGARRLAEALGVPLGLVLEGGYDLGALARSLVASLGVLAADAAPGAPVELAVDPHARAALERLRPRWPALA